VLESYGLGGRMQRGRRYARAGQVLSLEVQPGVVAAQVQGSRRTPYLITVQLPVPTGPQWATVDAAMTAKVGFVAHLLAGEIPAELEEVFVAAGVALFPRSWAEVRATCSCPDWENPCKHIAAVLYVFADRLDTDPWLLLAWRGRDKESVLAGLRGAPPAIDRGKGVAPWWPFPAGNVPDLVTGIEEADGTRGTLSIAAPEQPDAVLDVLDVLDALDVTIGQVSLIELLRPVYRHIVTAGEAGTGN